MVRSSLLGKGRNHNYRADLFHNYILQGGNTVLSGHVDIHSYHVRLEFASLDYRVFAISAHSLFDINIGFQNLPQHFPHQGGIISDQHPNHITRSYLVF